MKDEDGRFSIRAVSSPWHAGVELLIRRGREVAIEIVTKPPVLGDLVPSTITIPVEAAQTLMDDLWNAGLRPTEGTGSAGSLRATESHLADLRKIVFNVLRIK